MHEETKKKADKLVSELKGLFADRLVSVCVYGSAVYDTGITEDGDDYKNINVLVILDQIAYKDLEKANVIAKWWDTVAHSLPMFLSENEWVRSHDVYAMEAADIRDTHYIAYGKDLFSTVEVDKNALRLICELELHRKLIFIRQRLLLFRDDPKALTGFLFDSVNSFAALFRGVLRLTLRAERIPRTSQEVFESLRSVIDGYDPVPFLKVMESRQAGKKIPPGDVLPLFETYVAEIGRVVHYVDQKSESVVQR